MKNGNVSPQTSFDVMAALLNAVRHPILTKIMQSLKLTPQQTLPLDLVDRSVPRHVVDEYRKYRILLPILIGLGIMMWALLTTGNLALSTTSGEGLLRLAFLITAMISLLGFPVAYFNWFIPYYQMVEKAKWDKYANAIAELLYYIDLIRCVRGMSGRAVKYLPLNHRALCAFVDAHLLVYARAVINEKIQHQSKCSDELFRGWMRCLL